MKSITLKIAAGNPEDIGVSGDYVRIKSASVPVRIEAENGQVDATIEEGDALNLKQFTRLRVSHADAAEQAITLLIGNGTSSDSARVGGSIDVSTMPAVNVATMPAVDVATMPAVARPMTQTASAVGVASAQLVAANAARRFLLIQNTDAAASVFLNVAGAAAVLDQGVELPPGASVVFDVATPAGAVFAIASAATAAGAVVVVEG